MRPNLKLLNNNNENNNNEKRKTIKQTDNNGDWQPEIGIENGNENGSGSGFCDWVCAAVGFVSSALCALILCLGCLADLGGGGSMGV